MVVMPNSYYAKCHYINHNVVCQMAVCKIGQNRNNIREDFKESQDGFHEYHKEGFLDDFLVDIRKKKLRTEVNSFYVQKFIIYPTNNLLEVFRVRF